MTSEMSAIEQAAREQAAYDHYSATYDTDILYYNGSMYLNPLDLKPISSRKKRKNVLLILVTPGGDPNSAYRLARMLQEQYEKFTMFVTGYCKSAGTLVALGAHELIFSDYGELGPLDVQMSKKDDLVGQESGLTVMAALNGLEDQAMNSFEKFFLEIIAKSQGSITLKTAGEIATSLTTGLFSPLYAQIDPLHLGEAGRAIRIADVYGKRLADHGRNIAAESMNYLITAYPCHGFVIDFREASALFNMVRRPDPLEELVLRKPWPWCNRSSSINWPPSWRAWRRTTHGDQGSGRCLASW